MHNSFPSVLRKTFSSPAFAVFVLVSMAAIYSGGQEIFSLGDGHDSYFFVKRSSSYNMMGDYHATIKEYLYCGFIWLSRIYGVSLRTFEVICYGVSVFWLWRQTGKLTKSYFIAWITVFPLAIFTYQHPVFNRATYEGLQLILTPLTIASALQVFNEKCNYVSLSTASVIAGLQMLTRPEGILFIFPPLIAIIFVSCHDVYQPEYRASLFRFFKRTLLLCLFPFVFQQGVSAVNKVTFGFWAPTIMKSAEFQAALSALMSIKPADNVLQRYAPFPKSSMKLAYDVSPSFIKAKPFFDQNIDGQGWSSNANPGYRSVDGSISGGHLQWALLDASAFVAGSKPVAMLDYLKLVSEEIGTAFDNGKLNNRFLVSTAFGPQFSILDHQFWRSFWRLGTSILGFTEPTLPVLASVSSIPQVETDFNQLTLRKTGLLETHDWRVSGWLLNRDLGLPKNIALDLIAQMAEINLKLIRRPDVEKIILGLDLKQSPFSLCGFEISSPKPPSGNLLVEYPDQVIAIPLEKFVMIGTGHALDYRSIHIHIDIGSPSKALSENTHFKIIRWVTAKAHYGMRSISIISIIWLLAVVILKNRIVYCEKERIALLLIASLALSLILPRLGLLAAVDSSMYPGDESRYLSAAVFPVWFFSTFTLGYLIQYSLRWLKDIVCRIV